MFWAKRAIIRPYVKTYGKKAQGLYYTFCTGDTRTVPKVVHTGDTRTVLKVVYTDDNKTSSPSLRILFSNTEIEFWALK